MSKVEIETELGGDDFVVREFLAVVGGQGVHVVSERSQLFENGLRDTVSRAPFDLVHQGQTRFAFVERDDRLAPALTNDGIDFPIAESLPRGHNFRSLVDADAIGEYSTSITKPSKA